jgi:CheY-like chemotaxis protein
VVAGIAAAAPLRVLVAEDNEFNADLVRELLTRRGHEVHVATRGDDALVALAQGGFDLMLLDLHMPGLDGFHVIERIRAGERATGGHLPVIALTARSRAEDRERCRAAGMDGFVSKPIRASTLWEAIEQATSRRPPSAEPLDPAPLLAACGEDEAILARVAGALRRQLPTELAAAQESARRGELGQLRAVAHKLHGMVAAVSGAAGVVASEIEDQAAAGQLAEARRLLARLGPMVTDVVAALETVSVESLRALATSRAARS